LLAAGEKRTSASSGAQTRMNPMGPILGLPGRGPHALHRLGVVLDGKTHQLALDER